MTLIAVLAAVALAIAAGSLLRLSRLPQKPPPDPEERTFASLRPGDVVVTPGGDWLVEERSLLGEAPHTADLFSVRSGRDARFLYVPKEGALGLLGERPASVDDARKAALAAGARLERPTVDLLPGA